MKNLVFLNSGKFYNNLNDYFDFFDKSEEKIIKNEQKKAELSMQMLRQGIVLLMLKIEKNKDDLKIQELFTANLVEKARVSCLSGYNLVLKDTENFVDRIYKLDNFFDLINFYDFLMDKFGNYEFKIYSSIIPSNECEWIYADKRGIFL